MIRFIHTADIHFGMENYGKIDAKTGIHTRLLDFEKALSAFRVRNSFYFENAGRMDASAGNSSPGELILRLRLFVLPRRDPPSRRKLVTGI